MQFLRLMSRPHRSSKQKKRNMLGCRPGQASSSRRVAPSSHEHRSGTTVGLLSRALGGRLVAAAVALIDIVDHQGLEVGGDGRPAQGAEFLAVDNTGAAGASPVPGKEMPILA